MQLRVQFETIDDIKTFRNNLQVLKLQVLQFQARKIRDIANQITVASIHQKMRARGFSQKIIDGTFLDNIELRGQKKVRLFFRSVFFAGAFDVAVGREEGTDDHDVKPVEKDALHGGADWPFFSKGHEVSGVLAFFTVKETVKETAERVQDEYNRQLFNWYKANLGGTIIGR